MIWRAPAITRLNRQLAVMEADERAIADAWLDAHRERIDGATGR
ncbi:hypothetical protein SAMN05444920_10426 [Nonomuraea solani]|uniref:Uncharacterized protein n=1 Tax=Nonomuraea solani TaxID=1144553 RepID=A0A1H6CK57_9ACTN|nr:hypothetical protein [Nonomuraea solani]SEG72796.1 hypothetical protein SAMN05444920_10426 [Nonomuraea solani]